MKSLVDSGRGGPTLHFAKNVSKAPGFGPANCTIIGYYRTFLFEFPRARLLEAVEPRIIHSDSDIKAAIVSDLPDYFGRQPGDSPHYAIDVSLRDGVARTYAEAPRRTGSSFPLFLVVEENRKCPPLALDRGECVTMKEYLDGEELIEGGREGEWALVAVKTIDGAWPEFASDMYAIKIILAAVKVEQLTTEPIKELYRCSCFVDEAARAVYPFKPTMNIRASTVGDVRKADIRNKAERIEARLQGMSREKNPSLQELFDSLVLEETEDDSYLRLWYLRLWQAVNDSMKLLDHPQLWNSDTVVAGKKTPRELNEYRNKVAHWYTGKVDLRYLSDLQRTAMELLRRKYQNK